MPRIGVEGPPDKIRKILRQVKSQVPSSWHLGNPNDGKIVIVVNSDKADLVNRIIRSIK